jgi:hypothetical protein
VGPAGRDQIVDFLIGSDKIDLEQIDAVQGGGDNAFNFIGTAAFQNAGDLRAVAAGTTRWCRAISTATAWPISRSWCGVR